MGLRGTRLNVSEALGYFLFLYYICLNMIATGTDSLVVDSYIRRFLRQLPLMQSSIGNGSTFSHSFYLFLKNKNGSNVFHMYVIGCIKIDKNSTLNSSFVFVCFKFLPIQIERLRLFFVVIEISQIVVFHGVFLFVFSE